MSQATPGSSSHTVTAGTDTVSRNRALQEAWYGEPLGDRFRRLLAGLGLTQAQLAEVIGLSAPMLSQLMTGQRAKISNPAVLGRLQLAEALASDPAYQATGADQRTAALADIRAQQPTTSAVMSVTGTTGRGPVDAADLAVDGIRTLLRSSASAGDIEAASARLDGEFPALATILRVYGTGPTPQAQQHFRAAVGRV